MSARRADLSTSTSPGRCPRCEGKAMDNGIPTTMIAAQELNRREAGRRGGFTLTEVMVAIGVVAVGLLPIVALFSLVMDSYAEIRGQRAACRSLNALNNYLNEEVAFERVYQWASAGQPKELVFLTYRTNGEFSPIYPKGTPVKDGRSASSAWLDTGTPWFASSVENYDSAREGPWIKAVIELAEEDETGSESGGLPALEEYDKAYVMFKVRLYTAAGSNLVHKENKPLLTTVAVALR